MMTLGTALALLPAARLHGDANTRILRVHTDSRTLQPGDLFVALKGERFDAHSFLPDAQRAGAVAVLAGCSSSKAPATAPSSTTTVPAGYQVPRNVMFSEHWATTPAVDLMSPEGTYLRAYIEADHVADYNVDRADGSYPGFAKAARDRSYHWTGTGFPAKGFHTNWVHELTANPDGSATAVVCYAGEVSVSDSFPDN